MEETEKPGKAVDIVKPDYRARCLEWSLSLQSRDHRNADKIVSDAKTFYEYVYGTD